MNGIDRDDEVERGIRVRQGVGCAHHTEWPDVADRILDRVRGDIDTGHEDTEREAPLRACQGAPNAASGARTPSAKGIRQEHHRVRIASTASVRLPTCASAVARPL